MSNATVRWASSHLDFSSFPVNVWIMSNKPRMTEDKGNSTKHRDMEGGSFSVIFEPYDEVYCFFDRTMLVERSIDIVDRDGMRELLRGDVLGFNEVLINEKTSCARVKQCCDSHRMMAIDGFDVKG